MKGQQFGFKNGFGTREALCAVIVKAQRCTDIDKKLMEILKKISISLDNLEVVQNKIAIKDFFVENVYKVIFRKNTQLPPPYHACAFSPQCGS